MRVLTGGHPCKRGAALAFSADSRFVALGGESACSAWDLAGGSAPARSWPPEHRRVGLVAAGCYIWAGLDNTTWYRGDVATGERVEFRREVAGTTVIDAAAVQPSGGRVKSFERHYSPGYSSLAYQSCTYRVTPGGVEQVVTTSRDTGGPFSPLAVSPDGRLYLGVGDGYAVCDFATDAVLAEFRCPPLPTVNRTAASSPDGSQVVVGHKWGFSIHDTTTGIEVARHESPPQDRRGAAFHPAGRTCVTVDGSATVTLRDAGTLAELRCHRFALDGLVAAAFSPDGLVCAVGNSRGAVVVFDVDS